MANVFVVHVTLVLTVCVLTTNGLADADEGTCPTTSTASSAVGASLMQATSARVRIGTEKIGDGASPASDISSEEAAPEAADSSASVGSVASMASSLLQQSTILGAAVAAQSALSRFGCWCMEYSYSAIARLEAATNTSAGTWLVFVGILLILNVVAVYVLVYHPATFGVGSSSSSPGGERRNYFPMRSSPQMTDRNVRGSPLQPQHSPGRGTAMSRGTDRNLPKKMGDYSSDDDEPSKFATGGVPSDSQFCPDLVVPQHCECILVLPLDISQAVSAFEVTDVNGSPVLRVVPQPPTAGRLWRATITSASGELLAQCCEARHQAASTAASEYHLMRAGGQYFAKLMHSPAQDRYLLTLLSGGVLNFWGNFENRVVNITDDSNRLFATTEIGSADFDPQGKYCRLRVAPLADVGLALCGLLCVGQHTLSNRSQGGYSASV